MMKFKFLFLSLLVVLLPVVASAQTTSGLEISVFGGYAEPFGDDEDDLKLDGKFVAGGAFDFKITQLFSAGIGGSYMNFDTNGAFTDSFEASQLEARIRLYVPSMTGAGSLYALFAFGKHWAKEEGEVPIFGKITLKNDGVYASGGLGVNVALLPSLLVGAEGRFYFNAWSDYDSNDSDHNLDVSELYYWSLVGVITYHLPLMGN